MARPHTGRALAAHLSAALAAGLLAALAATTPAGALDGLDIRIGKALFNRAWVPAPASTRADDGLGPLFDARSCASCHPKDGRAPATVDANGHLDGRGVVLMLARPDGTGDPVYGRRLQIDAVPGLTPEGILAVRDTPRPDGLTARAPAPQALAGGPLAAGTGLSLRVAPDLRGRGLVERVPETALLAMETEQAASPVGGRLRRVALPDGGTGIGRFGWKAAQPTLQGQSSEAFFLDLGLSTPLHPEPWGDCTQAQDACRAAPQGREAEGEVEIPNAVLDRVVAYVASLPLPATPADTGGARLFAATGCAACHRPSLPQAGGGAAALFTDLMLHDLGPGLADTMPEPGAAASEWRTAPLTGLADALRAGTGLLHDGRARTVGEAVLWHGGQAADATERFRALSPKARADLVAYVSRL